MCELCGHVPCHPRCPNAIHLHGIYRCTACKENIVDGDEFVYIDDSYYHLECLEAMRTKQVLKICGYETREAVGQGY
ncbi:MAG TPA: DUF2175 domain-containing protein [Firmicutes bacterium]|nr:DUF2175 domain-containing protein [Bacillota bacterium]